VRHIAEWAFRAACQVEAADAMFARGAPQRTVKRVCDGCPVRQECLAEALDNRIDYGVWGGMTERERRVLLRRHPNIRSWRKVLDAAANRGADRDPARRRSPGGVRS